MMRRRGLMGVSRSVPVEVHQLVTNGNFTSTNNWTKSTYVVTRADNNIMTVGTTTGSNRTYTVSQNVGAVYGHKYLFSGIIKSLFPGSSRTFSITLGSKSLFSSTYTQGQIFRKLIFFENTNNSDTAVLSLSMWAKTSGPTDLYTLQDIQLFDLTEMYGAGNEPTTIEEMTGFDLPDTYYE